MDVTLDQDFTVVMVAGSELDYGFNWSDVLAPGETVLTSAWSINNDAFTHVGDTLDDSQALVRIGGGIAGRIAYATNTIVTTANRYVKRIRLVCIAG